MRIRGRKKTWVEINLVPEGIVSAKRRGNIRGLEAHACVKGGNQGARPIAREAAEKIGGLNR